MNIIKVDGVSSMYNIYINNSIKDFFNIFNKYIEESIKVFVISDNKVANLYKDILNDFKKNYSAHMFTFINGEENKNYNTINSIYNFLLENNADRNSIIVAVGGGVVGDVVGYVAATFMRGIRFINIPTTVISQVDSSVGGKVGYNYSNVKNSIGCFYNPEFVYVSTDFLKTLQKQQILDGMGEIIKYALIDSKLLLEFIDTNSKLVTELEEESILHIIGECLTIKSKIVAKDFRDKDIRNVLNFGHTVGHGIEVSSNYKVSHGIAVALGMLTALKLSEERFGLSKDVYSFIKGLYKKIGLPISYKVDNFGSFLYAIKHDKKNTDKINFVLLEDVGKCKIKVSVNENELFSALNNSIFRQSK